MPKTMLIEYCGPLRAYVEDDDPDAECVTPTPVVEIVDTGQMASYGVPIEVDATVAGRSPAVIIPAKAAKGRPGMPDYEPAVTEVWDAGEGLLAQTDNWRLVGATVPTMPEVLHSVGTDKEKAAAALATEQARGPDARKTLVDKLDAITKEPTS